MKEYYVLWDGASLGKNYCGTLFEYDIERIFSYYYYGVIPWDIKYQMKTLQPGQNIRYIFHGTTDTIEICNAHDLLDYE